MEEEATCEGGRQRRREVGGRFERRKTRKTEHNMESQMPTWVGRKEQKPKVKWLWHGGTEEEN